MTHVKISRLQNGGHSLIVDGVDWSRVALAEGFGIELATAPEQPDRVHVTVAADVLEVDLPDSVVTALREGADL